MYTIRSKIRGQSQARGPKKYFGNGRPSQPFGRASFSKTRGRNSGGFPRGFQKQKRGSFGRYIDPAKFVNKTAITEEVEHFIPVHAFPDFALDARLARAVAAKGYAAPTPIQDRVIPHILKGADVVGVANTGTGKTAAFLLPLIHKVLTGRNEKVFIVVPTRELAIQIEQELKSFTRGLCIFSACCVGGASISAQIRSLRLRNDFIIGTPGRLKDLIGRRMIALSGFRSLVLDEVDRMLDMGFLHDIRFLVSLMPEGRQSLFFSATIPYEIEKLIGEFLREPVRISVKTRETPKSVEQDVVRVERGKDKTDVLRELLGQKDFSKVLVFARTKHGAEKLARVLSQKGFRAESIHGNKSQSQRERALKAFKNSYAQILVATDVAARGLDIVDISHVINYDLPATYDDYVHRIGRTGRGEKRGKALTFIE